MCVCVCIYIYIKTKHNVNVLCKFWLGKIFKKIGPDLRSLRAPI